MLCLSVYLQDHQMRLFLCWWLGVGSKPLALSPPPPPPSSSLSSSSSLPPYCYQEYSVSSNLRFFASKTSSSCSWTGWILKERLLEQVFRCKDRKEEEQGWKRTHCLGAFREKVARDICIAANKVLSSKAIKAVSINWLRQAERINNSTGSRAFLAQVFHLSVISVQKCRWCLIKRK